MSKARSQSSTRAAKRATNASRDFSNKRGVQMVINKFFDSATQSFKFMRVTKMLQRLNGKTIVHYRYA